MKNSLLLFFSILTTQVFCQIPDSLNVQLPWELVNISDCSSTMGEGPISTNDAVFIGEKLDSLIYNDAEVCILRLKEWLVLDWLSGTTYDVSQIGKVKDNLQIECSQDIFIEYQDLPMTLTQFEVLTAYDPTHQYSFDRNDETDTELEVNIESNQNFELFVYDHTDKSVCKVNVYLSQCEDDIVLDFPETAEIIFNQEPYIEVTLEMLGVNIEYPCGSFSNQVKVGNSSSNLMTSQFVDKIVQVKVETNFENGIKYIHYIAVSVTGVKPDPLPMFVEEKSFNAGETVTLDVWSDNISGLIAWQFQIMFENAELVSIEEGPLFDYVPHNIFDEKKTLRALWIPVDGLPQDVETDETWFTITVIPEIDGSTFDVFSTSLDSWSAIGIEDENYIYEYEADFIFNVAPRNILSDIEEEVEASFSLAPNPVVDLLFINNIEDLKDKISIVIYDLQGNTMIKKEYNSVANAIQFDTSLLNSGIYLISIQSGEKTHTSKFVKI